MLAKTMKLLGVGLLLISMRSSTLAQVHGKHSRKPTRANPKQKLMSMFLGFQKVVNDDFKREQDEKTSRHTAVNRINASGMELITYFIGKDKDPGSKIKVNAKWSKIFVVDWQNIDGVMQPRGDRPEYYIGFILKNPVKMTEKSYMTFGKAPVLNDTKETQEDSFMFLMSTSVGIKDAYYRFEAILKELRASKGHLK